MSVARMLRDFLILLPVVACASAPDALVPAAGLAAEHQGQLQNAASIYLSALLKNPDNVALWLRVARIEYQLKNVNLTVNALQQALKIQPQNPEIYKRLSEVYADDGKPTQALEAIRRACELSPANSDYLMARGMLENWNKHPSQALVSYQSALQTGSSIAPDTRLKLLRDIASLQNQLRQPRAAIATLLEAVALSPNDAGLYQALAQSYAAADAPEMALENINKALAIQPGTLAFLQAKAQYAAWLKNYKLARDVYQQIETIDPSNAEARQALDQLQVSGASKIASLPSKSAYDIALGQFNEFASKRQYQAAANSIKRAISLKPDDAPSLYKSLSSLYAMENNAKAAFWAITQATRLAPSNIGYWRDRATIAAWAGEKVAVQESYQKILQLKPYDEEAMLHLAHTLGWRGMTTEALEAYQQLLDRYPKNQKGWLQYAEVLSWIEAYPKSFEALETYKKLGGDIGKYLTVKARVLALVGYYKSASAINQPLLVKKPEDSYLLGTQVHVLVEDLQVNRAVETLKKARTLAPDDPAIQGLERLTLKPLRTNVNVGADYTGATDSTNIYHIPTLDAQYVIKPGTSLLMRGMYEYATASPQSNLNPIQGGTSISDESLMLGFSHQFASLFDLTAMAGGLNIEGEDQHGIYGAGVGTNLGETASVIVDNSYNLFRPYLVPQSPRLISLQIMENRVGMRLDWQPYVQKYMNVVLSHSELSNFNGYWHYNIWPRLRVYSSEKTQLSLGVNADDWRFRRVAFNEGYFSPRHFQGYEGTVNVYHGFTENTGISLSGGFGAQKDETFPRFFYEEDLAAQLFIGIFKDWQLQVKGAYTLRENPGSAYESWFGGIVVTRRF